jgi:hypothetical protein
VDQEEDPPQIRRTQKGVPFFLYVALFFLLLCINALVAKFVVFSFAVAPGVSSIYIVVALMIVFTLWFGIYGAAAAYAGCYIGAGILSGLPPDVSLYWSLADLWQVLIPLIAFRTLGCDPALRNWRDAGALLVFGIVLNNLAGAAWGSVALAVAGKIPWDGIPSLFSGWFIGNVIVCLVLVPGMLYILTPAIEEHELFIRRYWD